MRWEQAADYAPWAEACGGKGIRVERPGEVEAAIAAALAHPGPALVDVMVNPDEPPMPAKITYEQAKGFASSFLHGQGRRASIASTIVGDKISQLKG